jgi:uncharacterized membrane protein
MIKKNKVTLIVTSLVMLIPIFVGLILWQELPEQVPYHWNIQGEVDGWAGKSMAVFFMPLFMLAMHWICVLATTADPKNTDYHPKTISLVLWICPVLNLVLNTMVYAAALNYPVDIEIIMPLLLGIAFILIGNLLPKCRQSYTMGIKLPWTLDNEENWNKTHRLAGKLWVMGGIVIMASALIGSFWILIGVITLMVAIPTVYSYCLYRKQMKSEE